MNTGLSGAVNTRATRGIPRDPDVEQIILHLEDRAGIRTAYASVEATGSVYKLISAAKIAEAPRGGPGERLVADNRNSASNCKH